MSITLDELVEEKIDEKLGLYDTSGSRRSGNEIRDQIQHELNKRPKTTHELQNAINATKSTVENHCEHLVEVKAAQKEEINGQVYWKKVLL